LETEHTNKTFNSIAIRLKGNQKLLLKAFKEVPINNLEMLIPDGRIMISKFDKSLLAVSAFFALSSVLYIIRKA
jgi:hypothetical protein